MLAQTLALAALVLIPASLSAQGILTVTPGRGAATSAGTGAAAYTGDGGAATAATLASPSAVAYDAAGNLYIADANNHVVREVVKATGVISTVAGTGTEGFGGDGGAATSAQLDTPTGIAIDKAGNLYIADSHNHRIREVSGGTITTIAGTGTKGFGGDGGPATAALLALPSAVAVDATGNVYIADANNHRIRKIASGTVTTIAGDGEELFAGDGGAATAAALDTPTGVAVDTAGNVYIADRLNQRVRVVSTAGTISTVAGSGAASFAGGFSGDGASATAATLSKPSGISVDASGNIYIADTNNQAVREVGGGAIQTIEGSATTQGFAGDGGLATGGVLNAPKAVAVDASGNLSIADTRNQRVRSGAEPLLTFPNTAVGTNSSIQSVTLANTGTAPLTVANVGFTGTFTTATGGSCPAAPITLAAGTSCTQNIVFLPAASGAATGNVTFSGTGVVPEAVLLAGTGTAATTAGILTANATVALSGQAITLTDVITTSGSGTPAPGGSVTFLDGTAPVGGAVPVATSSAMITTTLPTGNNLMSAVYSGDPNYSASTSNTVAVLVEDFNFTLTSVGLTGNNLTIAPGATGVATFNISPVNGPFNFPVTLSIAGLPTGATAVFAPPVITLGSNPTTFTLTIHAPAQARLHRMELFGGGGTVAVAMLLIPFLRRKRRQARKLRPLMLCLFMLLGLGASVGLTGCGGGGTGFFGQGPQTYTLTVTGTATNNGVTLQHSDSVTLTIE